MPSAPSGGTALMLSGVAVAAKYNGMSKASVFGGITKSESSYTTSDDDVIYRTTLTLPSGGTWRYVGEYNSLAYGGDLAGGSRILDTNMTANAFAIAIRIS